jgi:carbon-monoxide dehydrogenase small subunit
MSEEKEKKEETKGFSRREFLRDAGLVVGGATVGSMAILSACKGDTVTTTVTKTTPGSTSTTTVTSPPVTTTSPPVTVTSPPITITKVVEVLPSDLITFKVNGKDYPIMGVKPYWTLVDVLREKIGLTGTKKYCNLGSCGFCNVIMDGKLVMSCMVLASEAAGKVITTVEGLATGNKLHPIQQAMIDEKGFECGMCTSGVIMAAKALLDKNTSPTYADIQEGMSGAFCRCAQYDRIFKAVSAAAVKLKG